MAAVLCEHRDGAYERNRTPITTLQRARSAFELHRHWLWWMELHHRISAYQTDALLLGYTTPAAAAGFEPAPHRVTARCLTARLHSNGCDDALERSLISPCVMSDHGAVPCDVGGPYRIRTRTLSVQATHAPVDINGPRSLYTTPCSSPRIRTSAGWFRATSATATPD